MKPGYCLFSTYMCRRYVCVHMQYMIIACCDSRVDPCTVLNLPPGEAFVLRNIGNMVPAYSAQSACSSAASAIEYAVLHLKVKHLVVMGHSRCGAVKALMGIEDRFK
ncbi:hypothetical protein KP509_08G018300 [Ceratopteris richardii]|uniref:Carbonic anhydrase n=1 Tax=Ceratopteris richardii TaxID=49495 RepID=A0A8T2U6A5_CERRI|nr:hypothetical protein KP509_08G018300 [Ceratopteris richardii]